MSTFKKHLSKYSIDTIETQQSSSLDPDLYRSTIHAIINEIKYKYNASQLKQLIVNIQRLEEYNMMKLAKCNKRLESQAEFSFRLSEVVDLLDNYKIEFLKILKDSPDYRLDDLYKRFASISIKMGDLDIDHVKVPEGETKKKDDSSINTIFKIDNKQTRQSSLNKTKLHQNNKLLKTIQTLTYQNKILKKQIQKAKIDTESIISDVLRFKEIQQEYQNKLLVLESERNEIPSLEMKIKNLERRIDEKQQIIKQKDELVENYKNSIEKLKSSLHTPIKRTKSQVDKTMYNLQQTGLVEKIENSIEMVIKRTLQTPHLKIRKQQQQIQSPRYKSQKGSRTFISNKTPPRPHPVIPSNKNSNQNDLWNMLLVQCLSIQQMLDCQYEQ